MQHYTQREKQFGLCSIRIFFLSFLHVLLLLFFFFFCFFYWYFPWKTLMNDKIGWERTRYFSYSSVPNANEHSFNLLRFLTLMFTPSIFSYQTDSWWDLSSLDIRILFAFFIDATKSELLTLTFQSDTVMIWVHTKLPSFYYKANAFRNWELHPTHHCLVIIPTRCYP